MPPVRAPRISLCAAAWPGMRGRERFAWLAFGCALLGASRAAADSGSSEASWFSILAPGKGRPALVGDAACGSCHAAHAHTFHQTAHARTSVLASAATIQGSFAPGANLLHTAKAPAIKLPSVEDTACDLDRDDSNDTPEQITACSD